MESNIKLEDLVRDCIKPTRESQHEFYRYFYAYCFNVCIKYCQSTDDAQEIVNDGFLKIFMGLKDFEARYESFEYSLKGWIKKVIIYTAIDHCRKNKRNVMYKILDDAVAGMSAVEASAIDKISYDEILRIVQRLSPAYRRVFNLYAIQGYKHEEIAHALNISVGTSKSNLQKARLNIQKMISSQSRRNIPGRAAIDIPDLCEV